MRASFLLALATTGACAGPVQQLRAEHRQQAGELEETRAQLRAERRRVKDLENQVFLLTDRLETAQVNGARPVGATPSLPVEILSPDDVPEDGQLVYDEPVEHVEIDPEELAPPPPPPPRPRASPRKLAALPTSTELREPGAPPAAPPAPPSPPTTGDDAIALYKQATAALDADDHATAIARFRELIARFPAHEYADNAQYWLGEAFYDQKDYARAVIEFRATVTTYPHGNKVPDALLKIGLAYAALGDPAKARAALEQVLRLYPKTSPAAIAAARLEQLP